MSTDSPAASAPAAYTVPAGPFKGISAHPGEIAVRLEGDREYQHWDTHARTRHFLEVFPPKDGWSVALDETDLGLQMADFHTRDALSEPVYQPAWKFTASLTDPTGRVINAASVIQLLNCPAAFETGQTRARGKLYTALGLPSSPGFSADDPVQPTGPRANVSKPIPKIVAVVDVKSEPVTADAPVTEAPASAVSTPDAPAPAAATDTEASPDASVETPEVTVEASSTPAPIEHDTDQDPLLPAVSVVPAPLPGPAPATGNRNLDARLSQIPAGLLRQIKQRAAKAKVDVPEFGTLEQAQAFLATLVNPTVPFMGAGEGT